MPITYPVNCNTPRKKAEALAGAGVNAILCHNIHAVWHQHGLTPGQYTGTEPIDIIGWGDCFFPENLRGRTTYSEFISKEIMDNRQEFFLQKDLSIGRKLNKYIKIMSKNSEFVIDPHDVEE
jgi:hypothetical protein